jgi:site-specific DNA-methyltransferase (cytosine-N4-specific)
MDLSRDAGTQISLESFFIESKNETINKSTIDSKSLISSKSDFPSVSTLNGIRQRNAELDFKNIKNKYATHGIHTYPAVMIGPVARYCIDKYLKPVTHLIDPFVGSGSVLVESAIKNIHSVGVDLNPLAVAISKAKTTTIDIKEVLKIRNLIFKIIKTSKQKHYHIPENVTQWDFWFSEKILQDILFLIDSIETSIQNPEIKNFYKITLSEIIRKASYQRNGEFKRYRIKKEDITKHNFDVFSRFFDQLEYNIEGMRDYITMKNKDDLQIDPEVYYHDSRNLYWIEDNSFDGLLTSPPYGDSGTTVAYGQFSRFSLELLNFEIDHQINNLDAVLLGGKKSTSNTNVQKIESQKLGETLDKLYEIDDKRAKEVEKFYIDYFEAINEYSRILKPGSRLVYVVGNRTVKKLWIETDIITKEMFEQFEFKSKGIFFREIPNKRMPSMNSPTNVKGEKITTMVNEFIVAMEK